MLAKTIGEVPRSVQELAPLVDYHVELMNDPANPDIEIVTPGETWQTFTSNWIQYVLRSILLLLQTFESNFQLQQCYFYYFVKGRVDGFPDTSTVYTRNPKGLKRRLIALYNPDERQTVPSETL